MVKVNLAAEGSLLSISDPDRRIIFTSESQSDFLGLNPSEIIGADWRNFMAPEEVTIVEPSFRAFWKNSKPYDVLVHARRHDGSLKLVMCRSSLIRGSTRSRDLLVTETYPVEEALKRSEAERFACLDAVRDITFELAATTARYRLGDVTNALIEASASAERAVEMLAEAAGAQRR